MGIRCFNFYSFEKKNNFLECSNNAKTTKYLMRGGGVKITQDKLHINVGNKRVLLNKKKEVKYLSGKIILDYFYCGGE